LAGAGERFDAGGPDFDVRKVESADSFAEEGGFFVLGFGEGDLNVGAEDCSGKAGEAGSGTEVQKGCGAGVKVPGGEETFAEVTADDLLGIADRGEVGTGVPLEEEVEIGRELEEEGGGCFGKVGREEIGYGGF